MNLQTYCHNNNTCNKLADLLAKGKSLGETTRLMFNPNKRREEEKVELQAQLDAEEAKKGGAGAAKAEAKTTATDEDGEEEEEELEEPPLEDGPPLLQPGVLRSS